MIIKQIIIATVLISLSACNDVKEKCTWINNDNGACGRECAMAVARGGYDSSWAYNRAIESCYKNACGYNLVCQ